MSYKYKILEMKELIKDDAHILLLKLSIELNIIIQYKSMQVTKRPNLPWNQISPGTISHANFDMVALGKQLVLIIQFVMEDLLSCAFISPKSSELRFYQV